MKFKDKDGNVYENIDAVVETWCPAQDENDNSKCEECWLSRAAGEALCTEFAQEFPRTAAAIMNLEIIENELNTGHEIGESMMNTVYVRWFDGYYEEFAVKEVRYGSDLLFMRLTNGTNRHIPLRHVRWFGLEKASCQTVSVKEDA